MDKVTKTKDGRHHFKWMTYQGKKIRIDKDIAPLMTLLWRFGIETTNSCHAMCRLNCTHKYVKRMDPKYGDMVMYPIKEEHCGQYAWLVFNSVADLEHLFNLVAEYGTEMYDLMGCGGHLLGRGKTRYKVPLDKWIYSFNLENRGVQGHWGRPMINGKRSTQEMWTDDGCEENQFVLTPQVTFPRKHIAYLVQRLQKVANEVESKRYGR